jgi:hypothetical protein
MLDKPPIHAEPCERPQPRLSIAHLMLWMFTSALFLSLGRFFSQGMPGELRMTLLIYHRVLELIQGEVVAALPIWIARAVRGGPPFPVAPGHYLALLLAGTCLAQVLGNVAISVSRTLGEDFLSSNVPYFAIQFFVGTLAGLMGLVCLVFCSRPTRWLLVFLVFVLCKGLVVAATLSAMMLGWRGFGNALFWTQAAFWLSSIAITLTVLSATAIDLSRRVPRDWLHYVGVVACLAQAVTYWGFLFVMWVIRTNG